MIYPIFLIKFYANFLFISFIAYNSNVKKEKLIFDIWILYFYNIFLNFNIFYLRCDKHGTCSECKEGYFLTDKHICEKCTVDNCAKC